MRKALTLICLGVVVAAGGVLILAMVLGMLDPSPLK